MKNQSGQKLGQVLYQTGCCFRSGAQTDPTRLPVSLPLRCSPASLPPPALTLDLCPGDRRHQDVEISFWHGPVASATMWPRENKYGCLFGGSVRGLPAVAALQEELLFFSLSIKYRVENRTFWFVTVLLPDDAVILRDWWQDIWESQN